MNNNNLDKKLDPNLEKFIENVKAEFDHVTYKHRLNLSRELKKLSLSSENAKNNKDKSKRQKRLGKCSRSNEERDNCKIRCNMQGDVGGFAAISLSRILKKRQ